MTPTDLRPPVQTELQAALERATRAARASRPADGEAREGTAAASAVIAQDGRIIARASAGQALLFSADGALLDGEGPAAEVFDLASLTKIVVTVAALDQVRSGTLNLEDAVSEYLPEFAGEDARREQITIRHLLTHTSGLPAIFPHWRTVSERAERVAAVLAVPLIADPGAVHTYSCVGFQTLGLVLERLTGQYLPDLIAARVTGPLGMTATTYEPADLDRVAPTEYQSEPVAGLVHGQVHDEAARVLGGAGNAGLFGTAEDVLTFAEAIRTASGPIDEQIRDWMSTDQLTPPVRAATEYGQAMGMRVDDASFMGPGGGGLIGHTGFTGTSIVIDPVRARSVVLLTNRVHPWRSAFTIQALRRHLSRLEPGE